MVWVHRYWCDKALPPWGLNPFDMFLLIGDNSWKDNLLKSLALFFRNWKCGISSSSRELSLHKVESMDWLAKLTYNAELAIQEIWASSLFILSWPSKMELRTSSILSWLIRVEPSLGLMGLNLWSKISLDFGFGMSISKWGGLKCLPPFVGIGLLNWGLKCLSPYVGAW